MTPAQITAVDAFQYAQPIARGADGGYRMPDRLAGVLVTVVSQPNADLFLVQVVRPGGSILLRVGMHARARAWAWLAAPEEAIRGDTALTVSRHDDGIPVEGVEVRALSVGQFNWSEIQDRIAAAERLAGEAGR